MQRLEGQHHQELVPRRPAAVGQSSCTLYFNFLFQQLFLARDSNFQKEVRIHNSTDDVPGDVLEYDDAERLDQRDALGHREGDVHAPEKMRKVRLGNIS